MTPWIVFSIFLIVIDNQQIESAETCQPTTLYATDEWQNFTSPNYPKNYPSRLSCTWSIEASGWQVVIEIIDFDLEPQNSVSYDTVQVYEGTEANGRLIDELYGSISQGTQVHANGVMTVLFNTDLSRQFRGFLIRYKKGACLSTHCQETTALTVTSSSNGLSSSTVEEYIISINNTDLPSIPNIKATSENAVPAVMSIFLLLILLFVVGFAIWKRRKRKTQDTQTIISEIKSDECIYTEVQKVQNETDSDRKSLSDEKEVVVNELYGITSIPDLNTEQEVKINPIYVESQVENETITNVYEYAEENEFEERTNQLYNVSSLKFVP